MAHFEDEIKKAQIDRINSIGANIQPDSNDIEKGGKPASIGEIREFGGKKYQKTSNGWRPVKKDGGKDTSSEEKTTTTKIGRLGLPETRTKDEFRSEEDILKEVEYAKKFILDNKEQSEKRPELKHFYDYHTNVAQKRLKKLEKLLEGKKSQPKHISDMSKDELHKIASKYGIEGHEKMDHKTLQKHVTDKHIEKQLEEFRAKKK